MAEIGDLVPIDDNNTARWPEGMPPSDVNNAGRADEGLLARWHRDTNGSLVSTGTGAAYSLSTNQSLSAYYDGLEITFKAHADGLASPTLTLGAIGAVEMRWPDYKALEAGDILTDSTVNVIYQSGTPNVWQIMNIVNGGQIAFLNKANTFTEDLTVDKSGTSVLNLTYGSGNTGNFPVEVFYNAPNAASTEKTIVNLTPTWIDRTDTTEEGSLSVNTIQSGAIAKSAWFGQGVVVPTGNTDPTGGDLGQGWINAKSGLAIEGEPVHGTTAAQSLSGTQVDVTGLPANAKRITIVAEGILISGATVDVHIQIGDSGGIEITGYTGGSARIRNNSATTTGVLSAEFVVAPGNSGANALAFEATLVLLDSATNTWSFRSMAGGDGGRIYMGQGSKALTGVLDRFRIKTPGTAFTAGSFSYHVEVG